MDFKTAKKIVKKLKYVLISWDWKEEVNIVQLSRYTQRGYVYLYDLDTDSDEYVIACSKTALTPRERQAIEWASFGSDEEEEKKEEKPEFPSNIRWAENGEHQ